MTTFVNYTNLPAGPIGIDTGINLQVSGRPDQKYVWQNGSSPGVWLAVDDDGVLSTPQVFLQQKMQKFSYDFATDGGAIGNVTLRGGSLPDDAIITGQPFMDIETAFTDGGTDTATVALTLQSAGDIAPALQATIYPTGVQAVQGAAGGYGYYLKLTADRSLILTIAEHALTSGKFDVYISYVVPV